MSKNRSRNTCKIFSTYLGSEIFYQVGKPGHSGLRIISSSDFSGYHLSVFGLGLYGNQDLGGLRPERTLRQLFAQPLPPYDELPCLSLPCGNGTWWFSLPPSLFLVSHFERPFCPPTNPPTNLQARSPPPLPSLPPTSPQRA